MSARDQSSLCLFGDIGVSCPVVGNTLLRHRLATPWKINKSKLSGRPCSIGSVIGILATWIQGVTGSTCLGTCQSMREPQGEPCAQAILGLHVLFSMGCRTAWKLSMNVDEPQLKFFCLIIPPVAVLPSHYSPSPSHPRTHTSMCPSITSSDNLLSIPDVSLLVHSE